MNKKRINILLVIILSVLMLPLFAQENIQGIKKQTGGDDSWQPVSTPIITRWGKDVTVENAWHQYPRPMLVRQQWQSLNGLWDYAVTPAKSQKAPSDWDGKILVPYPIQSALSGVAIQPKQNEALWYRTPFTLPSTWEGKRIILHFEAVDFETQVWLNGKELGSHLGSYDAFSFDLTDHLLSDAPNVIVVKTLDGTEIKARSVGKQRGSSKAYENLTGIWQSVWLEPVNAQASIQDLRIQTTLKEIQLSAKIAGKPADKKLTCTIKDGQRTIASVSSPVGRPVNLRIPAPKLWSPDNPFLYDIEVTLEGADGVLDSVKSYCGMRTIERDTSQTPSRILLNGEAIFQMGPLDQHYWPESGLAPPSDAAMRWEAEYLRRIGCNMVRLHIKRNPRRYYTHCDRVGLLVWQDFVCGRDKEPSREDSDFWANEQKLMVEQLYNHPSIMMWIIFNESWGQHETERVFSWSETLDSSRLFCVASGWNDSPNMGDIRDLHDYTFAPAIPVHESRAVVLGECGGFASAVPPHNWTGRSNKTGRIKNPIHGGFNPEIPRDDNHAHDIFRPTFTSGKPFENQYDRFVDHLCLLKASGLVGAVYTQMTDMKLEENGWLTFDRQVSKMDPDRLGQMHARLYKPAPNPKVISPSSLQGTPQNWMITTLPLPQAQDSQLPIMILQQGPDLKSVKWKEAKGPFGNDPAATNGTHWDIDSRLIMKRVFSVDEIPDKMSVRVYTQASGTRHLWIHSRIYINGQFVADDTTRHEHEDMKMAEVLLSDTAIKACKSGSNTIMIEVVPGLDAKSGTLRHKPNKVLVDYALVHWED